MYMDKLGTLYVLLRTEHHIHFVSKNKYVTIGQRPFIFHVHGAVTFLKNSFTQNLKIFLDSVDRVASVSLDKKDGVKFNLKKDVLNLSVNNANSGDGNESLSVNFDHELDISFNSRYLMDIASQLDGDKIEIFFNDLASPALIKDPSDFDSIFVVMPMKG